VSKPDPIYKELTKKMKFEKSKFVPTLLQKIANVEQAKVMYELPNTPEEIAKKLKLDKATVEKHLQYLFERGVVTSGKKGWNLVTNPVLLKDFIATAPDKYWDDETIDLARDMSLEEPREQAERIRRGEEKLPLRLGFRVLPKWRSIKDIPGVLPIEDVREIFRNTSPIMVKKCPCRSVHRERACQGGVPIEACVSTGQSSRRSMQRGTKGRELTYDELIAFFDEVDKYPVVSLTGNSNRMPMAVCSCCPDCCGVFIRNSYVKPVLGQYAFAKSRFVVEDNPEECTACGICTDNRCPVGAITMKDFPKLGGKRSYTEVEECIGCGLCVLTCPNEARKMKLVRPPEHIPDAVTIFDEE
jgi:NAD-dependent dihydropyrimidine dehydrogenase PreA subunit/DNA-binding transcriptional ArsR family regulator